MSRSSRETASIEQASLEKFKELVPQIEAELSKWQSMLDSPKLSPKGTYQLNIVSKSGEKLIGNVDLAEILTMLADMSEKTMTLLKQAKDSIELTESKVQTSSDTTYLARAQVVGEIASALSVCSEIKDMPYSYFISMRIEAGRRLKPKKPSGLILHEDITAVVRLGDRATTLEARYKINALLLHAQLFLETWRGNMNEAGHVRSEVSYM